MTKISQKDPDISGFARAWKMDMTNARAANPHGYDATVSSWIVNAPWSHPIWPNVWVGLIHLRQDIAGGAPPPIIHMDGATHELLVLALNPDHEPEVDGEKLDYLTPANFVGQFRADSDEAAAAVVEKVVRRICDGTLNPDTDATSQGVALFGDHGFKDDYKRGVVGSVNEGVPL